MLYGVSLYGSHSLRRPCEDFADGRIRVVREIALPPAFGFVEEEGKEGAHVRRNLAFRRVARREEMARCWRKAAPQCQNMLAHDPFRRSPSRFVMNCARERPVWSSFPACATRSAFSSTSASSSGSSRRIP